jgi:PAS domain S-box-containing protein
MSDTLAQEVPTVEGAASNLETRWPALMAATAGIYALVVGVLTLLGYALDMRRLTDWNNDGISMFPNAAVCAVLSGVALLVLTAAEGRRSLRIVVRILAGIVGLVGGLTLLQHLAGVNFGIDTLLFQRPWGQRAAAAPMRMGLPASTSYFIIGTALLLATYGSYARRWASALGIAIVGIASLSLIGYWFGADQLFGVAQLTGIAFQTSTVLAAIGIGLIASLPDRGLTAALRRGDPGGVIVRRLLLPVVAIPLALGWVCVWGQETGYFDTAFGTALLALSMIVMLFALLWWTAEGVSRQTNMASAAEDAVRESEARYRSLFEVGVYGVLTIDERGNIESVNPAAERLFGYSSSEMLDRNISMLMPEPYRAEHDTYLQNYLRTGVRKIIGIGREVVGRRKDGSTFPMDLAVAHFEYRGRRYFTGTVHDITERKRTAQALLESEAALRGSDKQLRLALEAGEMGTWSWDLRTNHVAWSTGLEAIHGFVPGKFPGTFEAFQSEVHPDDRLLVARAVERSLSSGQHHVEYRIIRTDQAVRWVEGHGQLLRDESGAPVRMVGICRDITERREAEEALNQSAEALLLADRRKDEFLATLGHELRNVLTPLDVGAQLLRDAGDHADLIAPAAATIHRQTRVLTRLVDDLLDVSTELYSFPSF